MYRMRHPLARLVAATALLGGLAMLNVPTKAAATGPAFTVVARGLDNPRGLAFGPKGELYVAEAGKGGAGPCVKSPEGGGASCYGPSGAVTRLWQGKQQRIITGLPSAADKGGKAGPAGANAGGPHDVSVDKKGNIAIVIGLGANPQDRAQLGIAGAGFGQLISVDAKGAWRSMTDVSSHEVAANPDSGEIDSNPYAVLAEPNGGYVIAEAGGNALLRVDAKGHISTLATFPDRMVTGPDGKKMPMQAVPTSITRGSDGAYYVGELTGFPFPKGAAQIYRVVPGQAPTVYAKGFTNIISLAFGRDGSLYVLEINKDGLLAAEKNGLAGALIRVAPDGMRTTVLSKGLVAPTGLAVGPDGKLYVSTNGVFAGKGQVIRIAS